MSFFLFPSVLVVWFSTRRYRTSMIYKAHQKVKSTNSILIHLIRTRVMQMILGESARLFSIWSSLDGTRQKKNWFIWYSRVEKLIYLLPMFKSNEWKLSPKEWCFCNRLTKKERRLFGNFVKFNSTDKCSLIKIKKFKLEFRRWKLQ